MLQQGDHHYAHRTSGNPTDHGRQRAKILGIAAWNATFRPMEVTVETTSSLGYRAALRYFSRNSEDGIRLTIPMRTFKSLRALFLGIFMAAPIASAHPVAYDGARQWVAGVSGDAFNLEFYQSYTARTAWGLHAMAFDRDENDGFIALQHNWLLNRWNLPDAQANLYAGLGAGGAKREGESAGFAGVGFFRADYETRRVYTAFEAKGMASEPFNRGIVGAEAGFAPYLAEFDELNTWIILQAKHTTGMDDEFNIIPKLRFFKNNIFVELGATHRGKPVASLMIHF